MITDNSGYESFCLYQALKLHFTSESYNFMKYHGKTNVTKDTFMKRKDKYTFHKLSRKYSLDELRNYILGNMIYGKAGWIGEMTEDSYMKWQKINQSLTYVWKNDIVYLMDQVASPTELITVKNGEYPKLLTETMQENIAFETLVILDDLLGFFEMWSKKISDDVIWPNIRIKALKYKCFLSYDKNTFKNYLKELIHAEA
jgi:T4 gene Gp59 loader of gp41 DNA helicase/T4 gene Gp59 loader of gp41 DNA helicase C-term